MNTTVFAPALRGSSIATLLLTACTVASTLVAADSNTARVRVTGPTSGVVVHATSQETIEGLPRIERGMPASEVEALLGPASVVAPPDVWVYWDYRLAGAASPSPEHDTLLVVFRHKLVAELRLVSGASARGLLARLKRDNPSAGTGPE